MTIENVKYPPAVNLFITRFWKLKICVALSLHFPGIFAMSYKLRLHAIFSSLPQQWLSGKKVATILTVNNCRSPSICQQLGSCQSPGSRNCIRPSGKLSNVAQGVQPHDSPLPSARTLPTTCIVITLSQKVHCIFPLIKPINHSSSISTITAKSSA